MSFHRRKKREEVNYDDDKGIRQNKKAYIQRGKR